MPVDCIGLYNDVNEILCHTRTGTMGGPYAIQNAISGAIRTAVGNALSYCTVVLGGTYTQLLITTEMNNLQSMGYQVSYSGSTLTVRW